MSWLTDRQWLSIAVILYGLSATYSIFLLRKQFREDNRINYFLLLLAFGFHTIAMFVRGLSLNRCPINNLYEATTFVAWTMVAAYLVIGLWSRLRFLGAFASPLLFAIGVFALLTPKDVGLVKPEFTGAGLTLHVALFALAYGAFGLSSVAGLMYLTQERDLKMHKLRAVVSFMPPIQRLELVTGRLLLAGFALLSAALVASALFLRQQEGVAFRNDFKILWSLFVWALYLGLIVMRWRFWQGGRRFAWGTICAFAFVLLTFWGSSLMSPLHRP